MREMLLVKTLMMKKMTGGHWLHILKVGDSSTMEKVDSNTTDNAAACISYMT